ncbi:MAG: HDIG domain-containing protein [Syntrophorhabdaceae bacterium]|nr:HDIG domain-containing protein [Syntrophorhabdaceae bacterium]
MQGEKDKPPSYRWLRPYLIILLFSLVISAIINFKMPVTYTEYHSGDIARENIKSPADTYLPDMDITLKKGEMIIREGEKIGEEHLNKLYALKSLEPARERMVYRFIFLTLFIMAFTLILYENGGKNIKKFHISEKDLIFSTGFLAFTVLFCKALFLLSKNLSETYSSELSFVMPYVLFGMVMRIVLFSEASLLFSILFSVIMGLAFEPGITTLIFALSGSILSSYFSGRCENRNAILKAGLYTSLILCIIALIFTPFEKLSISNIHIKCLFILLGGIGSSFIALGILPIIEHIFGYTTDVKLLELTNLEHPLLEEMMVNAPGTYHHSILVGNLSKAAAESIGANPLLARVASYYHDIGKMKMAHYFIENRKGYEDAHESLSPNMSALIILSHVKEGVELAERYRLGEKITNIIKEHHGTSLVTYFYNRAKQMEDPELHVTEEKDFRYSGPKPQTKEAGIVMLADAVEASSRLLSEPTPKRIETHVQSVIENIFLDGQLDECELTLKDLHAIQKSFIKILIGVFHQRIEYPERSEYDGTHKRFTKVNKNGQKENKRDYPRLAHLFRAQG